MNDLLAQRRSGTSVVRFLRVIYVFRAQRRLSEEYRSIIKEIIEFIENKGD